MNLSLNTVKGLFLAGAASVLLSAPALAAPAGDEYLPKVPKSAGKGVVATPQGGAGSTILEPKTRGANQGTADGATGSSSDDSGGGSTLLDPVILLIVAGVIAAAVGMFLRTRQGAEEDVAPEDAAQAQGDTSTAATTERPTPVGEIVGGEAAGEPRPRAGSVSERPTQDRST
jgi:hypothetical protein